MSVRATTGHSIEQSSGLPGIVVVDGRSDNTAARIIAALTEAGFGVDHGPTWRWGRSDCGSEAVALYILDLDAVTEEDVNFIAALRGSGVAAPIIALVAHPVDAMAMELFNAGADAVLPAQLNASELLARCHALLRRTGSTHVLHIGSLQIDTAAQTVHAGGRMLDLSTKQFALLEQLARRAGQIATRQLLLDCLYGGVDTPDVGVIDFFVYAIRRQLKSTSSTTRIVTIRGLGYCLNI